MNVFYSVTDVLDLWAAPKRGPKMIPPICVSLFFARVYMVEKGSRGILQHHIDKEIIIHHVGGLETQGLLKACDSNMNMYLTLASRKSVCGGELRPLGAIFVRGSNVSSVLLKEGLEELCTGPSI
ncbi:Ribonucleoprotein LSM domain eukaryotic/archaea-type [Perkinsela sp. CCAP 1560/4]|nr:Ribonucleoprotein LSM domain eukaryotic/archaea-type [Perkinsela sp. CCAP 1560/4]|eukprot:KNH08992.1 Ribonucleoprotein LSM domain eukaryotic/archaea-type [Perkinsela sp. CCAP 1560/4]